MRKLITTTFVTLDGVMQAPGGPGEDEVGGFSSGGWSVNYFDDGMNDVMTNIMGKPFAMVFGRKTYQILSAYWPSATEPGADDINNAPKYVVSRTLDKADWQNTTLIKGDAVQEIGKLKQMDGPELQVHGSSDLIQTLLKHNLIDELYVHIFPVTVGKGKRLFGESAPPSDYKLVNTHVTGAGVISCTYARRGDLKVGSFA